MEVSRIRALRGPNLWSHHTAMEAIVSCSEAERSVAELPGFEDRLRALFPELSILQPTGHNDAVPMAHVFELTALGLQAQAGCPVTFSRTTQTLEDGIYQVVVEYSEEQVGRLALELAEKLIGAALRNEEFDLPAALEELRELDEDVRLGPSTGAIVNAAVARNIPYRRLTEGSLVVFGWGSRQRRIQAAEMDITSAISEAIAQDKELTKKLLHAAGVPVPLGRSVSNVDDAWAAALEVGLPVVVKPQDGNQGKGVTVNITTREQLEAAYQAATEFRDDIMVERFLPGNDFRLLVIGNKLIAAARRDPPQVIGDGEHSVRQLVEITKELLGFPRHLSQHPGGFVLTQGPLTRMVPVENASMPDRTVIEWDKDDLDAVGLLKVDVLGLGMLTAIRKTLDLIVRNDRRPFGMADIPAEDEATYRMIQAAETIGVFQIESRAQRSMLPRLRPERFYDLVIEVAIVRPGPIQGGMVHPYLQRREMRRILEAQYAIAKQILVDHREKVETMTQALMEWETIDAEQVEDIMAGRPPRPPKDGSSSGRPGTTPPAVTPDNAAAAAS